MFYKMLITLGCFISFAQATLDIRNLETFTANFTQSITSLNGKVINYNGEVFIKDSGKILWKYKKPIIKNVFIINNTVIIDEPELEQAIYTQLDNENNIIKLINSSQKIANNQYLTKIDNTDYLILTKKDDNKIHMIKYKDKLDNNVEIVFDNVNQNIKINDEIFRFTAPDYYDIIRK
ncbi:LolA-like outer membrane lipoprotein chaperone [Poseidonibacter sp.]|uniref:LolA-like outer membrane lipoprotein chaperone n=1 Tax=Poseidonibacter sp. TaxID=2321188 RepID=UPI003C7346BC